ncbi:MAG TPA: tetratricopeptide repeat protein, partial [Candidatus Cloacimonadota bacterium]|nr:tetratricopeptide repeat protein [Candidatus Cloacimonadota bacterium]
DGSFLKKRIESGKADTATEFFDFGSRYLKNNQLQNAIACYEKAISFDPDYCEAYINLAIAYAKAENNEKAIQTLEAVLSKDPNTDYLAYLNMAQVYKRFNPDEAEKAYQKAISINPYLQDAYFSFGEFYWNLKEYDKSVENLKKGLELQSLTSYYTSALVSGIKSYSEFPEVVNSLQKILDQGITDEIMNKYDSLVFDFYYLKNNSQIAEKYDQVGYYYLRNRNFSAASEYFEKSIQCWNSPNNLAYKHLETSNHNLAEKEKNKK